ncbi:hypothetical protein JCM21714_1862 [Gracilibacillus boraciitolerans JCM 21714]|uniref:Uncharacterized protein n=1 Tax=Gracilibacillus boraciitolerans JCM 21714 TaxID=1298598 RepID=W4VI44_9BACI|nr:hypothetical protein JCM21714_1862 [Gracilibacillus boraciitolerans JCM 21714]
MKRSNVFATPLTSGENVSVKIAIFKMISPPQIVFLISTYVEKIYKTTKKL